MRKDKWSTIRDFIVRNCKIVFPVILVVVVAFTVVVALNANKAKAEEESSSEESSSGQESQQAQVDPTKEQVPLTVIVREGCILGGNAAFRLCFTGMGTRTRPV